MELSPAQLTEDSVFAAVAEVEARRGRIHPRRLELPAEVPRCGHDRERSRCGYPKVRKKFWSRRPVRWNRKRYDN